MKAFITGITGMVGSHLAEFLLENTDWEIHGLIRWRSPLDNIENLIAKINLKDRVFLHYGDLTDSSNLTRILKEVGPDEVYNLAAQSHVAVSFEVPEYTANVVAVGTLRLLEAIRLLGLEKKIRFYQASTSELYGEAKEIPQTETTPFYPRSPYAVAKMYAYWITVNYRESYGIYACNGILFNHESPKRGETFVTRKITRAVAKIALGLQEKFFLGNLEAKRDWGHAKDYVRMMWMILQAEKPEDWVIATGVTTTVRDFVRLAFGEVGIEVEFKGEGVNEKGFIKSIDQEKYSKATGISNIVEENNDQRPTTNVQPALGKEVLSVDPTYFRPTEVDLLIGDPTKAKEKLGWVPEHDLASLVKDMMQGDVLLMKKDVDLLKAGHKILKQAE